MQDETKKTSFSLWREGEEGGGIRKKKKVGLKFGRRNSKASCGLKTNKHCPAVFAMQVLPAREPESEINSRQVQATSAPPQKRTTITLKVL